MSEPSYRSLRQIGEQSQGPLKSLQQKLMQLQAIAAELERILPDNLKSQCRVAGLKDCTLLVCSANQAWASRLRFQLPQLLSQLRAAGFPWLAQIRLSPVSIQIEPIAARPETFIPVKPVSDKSCNELRQLAQQIQEPELKQALERLLKRITR